MNEPIINQRRNFIWNMLGTFSSAAVSIVLLLIVSRLTNAQISDTFSIAFTLSQQFVVIAYYGVRNFQSTDTKETYSFYSYLLARIFTVAAMLVVMLLYSMLFSISGEKFLILLFMTLYRSCEAFSDVFQGLFQQHQRSDLAGKVLFFRSVMSLITFSVSIYITNSLLQSTIILFVVNLILFFIYDLKFYKKKFKMIDRNLFLFWRDSIQITKFCTIIFLSNFLINSIFNDPKLVIDKLIDSQQLIPGTQRDFNILFMPTFVLNLLLIFLRPLITELSIHFQKNETSEYSKKVKLIFYSLVISSFIVLLVGYFLGIPVLSLIFGINLQNYSIEFFILLFGGVLNLFAILIDYLLTIQRKQNYLLFATLLTFFISKLIVSPLIQNFAILGASISFTICMFVYLFASLIVFYIFNLKNVNYLVNK
ncbi:lipopolysaccharide biosynthesis protein [Streptococcus suis]|uniref:lipopolysaccharide biosynthesis protein n=1 Tax=Streptococcus suis TaxID=1307 RepID=UPI00041AB8FC|nr:lipopolysaccharide biosynthesis protein [Streptococcus suis]